MQYDSLKKISDLTAISKVTGRIVYIYDQVIISSNPSMVMTSVRMIKHMAVMKNLKKLCMLIITYLQTEIILSIRKMIPK